MKTKIIKIIKVTVCVIALIALVFYCLLGFLLKYRYIVHCNGEAEHISFYVSKHLTDESVLPKEVLEQKDLYLFFEENGSGAYIKPCELFPDGKQTKEVISHKSRFYVIHFKEGAVCEVWNTSSEDGLQESDLRPYDLKEQKKQYGHIYNDEHHDVIGYWNTPFEY